MAGEIFKLFGSVYIDDKEANKGLDSISQKSNATAEKVGKGFSKAGDVMLGFAAAVGGIALGAFIPFEAKIADINTLLDDTTNLEKYKGAVLDMSNKFGMSSDVMATGMYQTISSIGDIGQETVSMYEIMAKSAKAGGAEVTDSVGLISAGMKGFGQVNQETAMKISDLAFQTAKLGVTTFPEMAKSMQPLFPLASTLNFSLEDLFGSMATLTGVTGNTAEVSTQLKAIFSGLISPTTEMAKLIGKYGYANGQAMIETEGMTGLLKILQKETGGQADAMGKLFGSSEAIVAMLTLTGEQYETFTDKTNQMTTATGATNTAFEKVDNTMKSRIMKIVERVKNSFIKLGEACVPAVESIVEKVEKFATWLSDLDTEQMKTIASSVKWIGILGLCAKAIGGIITGGAKLNLAMGLVSTAFGSSGAMAGTMAGAMGTATKAMGATAGVAGTTGTAVGAMGGTFGLLLNPITLAVGAIAGLGVALVANEKKLKSSSKELANMGISLEQFDGKVRTSDNLWTSVFGKKIELNFSEELMNESIKMEESVISMTEKYQKLDENIESILNNTTLTNQEKVTAITEAWKLAVEEQKVKAEEGAVVFEENINTNARNVYEFLKETTGASAGFAQEQANLYRAFSEEQVEIVTTNEQTKYELLVKASEQNRDLTTVEKAELQRLDEESAQARLTLMEMTGEDVLNLMKKENFSKQAERGLDTQNQWASDKEKLASMAEWSRGLEDETDKTIESVKKYGTVGTEATDNEIKRLEKMKSGQLDFATLLSNTMNQNMDKYGNFDEASDETMRSVSEGLLNGSIDVESFGLTQEKALAMVMEALVKTGADSDSLTLALGRIPKKIQPKVISEVSGKDKVDSLKEAIDRVKDKTVNITTNRISGIQENAKGTEGINTYGSPMATSLVGEQGPEIVQMPRGSKVKTHRETRNSTDDKGQLTAIINFDGATFMKVLVPYFTTSMGENNRRVGFGNA